MANNELQMPTAKKYKMPFKSLTKRDGTLADFDGDKIYNAILRAGENTLEFGSDDAWLLCAQVMKILSHKFDESLPSVEDIQDIVEEVLISNNYFKTAKAYILYRDKRSRMRSDGKTVVDVESSINEYLENLDWRIKENANQGYSNGGLILNVSGELYLHISRPAIINDSSFGKGTIDPTPQGPISELLRIGLYIVIFIHPFLHTCFLKQLLHMMHQHYAWMLVFLVLAYSILHSVYCLNYKSMEPHFPSSYHNSFAVSISADSNLPNTQAHVPYV